MRRAAGSLRPPPSCALCSEQQAGRAGGTGTSLARPVGVAAVAASLGCTAVLGDFTAADGTGVTGPDGGGLLDGASGHSEAASPPGTESDATSPPGTESDGASPSETGAEASSPPGMESGAETMDAAGNADVASSPGTDAGPVSDSQADAADGDGEGGSAPTCVPGATQCGGTSNT